MYYYYREGRCDIKVIICGPRDFHDFKVVCEAIEASGMEITEVVSGAAKGVDTLGEDWAANNDIPVTKFPAEWKNLKQTGARVKENSYGKYNANAGLFRNKLMAEYAGEGGGCIAIDTGSGGTSNMINNAKENGLTVFTYDPDVFVDDKDYGYIF